MHRSNRILLSLVLSVVTCLFLVSTSIAAGKHLAQPNGVAAVSMDELIEQKVQSQLQAAESVLLAQEPAATSTLTRYVAVMKGNEIVPNSVSTYAFGAAGAALVGDRLVMRGDFSNLTSALRDYATDPLSPPNPNITSGVHIHQGTPDKNGPFQYALTVEPKGSGNAGRFMGEYTLTPEQLQALTNGTMYVDLHTKQNRGGELRGILKPY